MKDIIDITESFEEYIAPEDMTRDELNEYIGLLRADIAALDLKEPKSMTSKRYEAWADEHEELEDLLDEALELLEDMK